MTEPTALYELVRLYGRVFSASFFARLDHDQPPQLRRDGIYNNRLTVWLMMWQALQPNHTLAAAVEQLTACPPQDFLTNCKRVREDRIALRTGGYSQARKKLPLPVACRVHERTIEAFAEELTQGRPEGPPVFILDGSTLQVSHERSLQKAYPPAPNQHGGGHWGILHLLVAHDAYSGLALRPAWGPMYGPEAISEQKLAERVIEGLPAGAIMLVDRNFGNFATVYGAVERQHPVVVRLNAAQARRLAGKALHAGNEQRLVWRPSPHDRRAHPDLPEGASVEGRLLVACVAEGGGQVLFLFTTLERSAREVVDLYKLRWHIETDLRSLKRTVAIDRLRGRSPQMVEKELLVALATYNLVRTVMCLAAREAGVTPRELSFTRVLGLVRAFLPSLADQRPREEQDRRFNRLVRLAATCKLPKRRRRRSYPREAWGCGFRFPTRKTK